MCNPANQMGIAPKKARSLSEMKEFCNECLQLHIQPEEKEIHLQLDNEYS